MKKEKLILFGFLISASAILFGFSSFLDHPPNDKAATQSSSDSWACSVCAKENPKYVRYCNDCKTKRKAY